jgi:hypothetical protein
MSDVLLPFIKSLHAYELADTIEKAIEVFDDFEIDYEATYLNIISQSDSNEVGDTIIDLIDASKQMLDQILSSFAVTVNEDVSLNDRIKIIQGLAFIDDYEDRETLFGIFSNRDIETIDRAIAVLEVTSEFTEDELYERIMSADLDYMAETVESFIPSEEDLQEARGLVEATPLDVIVKEVRRFVKYAKKDDLYLIRQIRDGLSLGKELYHYTGDPWPFDEVLADLPPEDASLNMILASLASGIISSEKIIAQWHDNIDRFVTDVNKITKITLAMRKQLVEFEQYEKE